MTLERTDTTNTPQTATIRLHNPDEALALLGENDQNLKRLRDKLEAKILARGDSIRIEGEPADVDLAERAIRDLLAVVRQGGELSLEEIDRTVSVSSEGGSLLEDTKLLNKDLELPKRLRPKTKGQSVYVDAINSSDITFGIGPAGTGKCVSADTLVLTGCGLTEIGALGAQVPTNTARSKATRIYGLDGPEWASHVYNGGEADTIRVTTRHGFQIEGTLEHPLLTINPDGELRWVKIGELEPGMFLALSRDSGLFGEQTDVQFEYERALNDHSSREVQLETLDADLAYFIGLLIGDGCMTRRGWVLFSARDPELRDHFARIAERFGLGVTTHGEDLRINSTQLHALLLHLGLSSLKAHEKTVPDSILRAPREQQIAFLQGLFDTDGTVDRRDGSVSVSSSSERLVRVVQLMLLNLGAVGVLRSKTTTHRRHFILDLRGADAARFLERVGFRLERKQQRAQPATRNTNLDVLPNIARVLDGAVRRQRLTHATHKWLHDYRIARRRPSYPKLREIVNVLDASPERAQLEWLCDRALLWSEVTTLEASRAAVFDLTVPKTHSFTANGFVSHNTYLAVAMAVAAFKAKRVKRIILTRPAVEAGERLGFLPGDLQAKIDPYLRPLYDALFDMIDAERFDSYLTSGAIEVAPLAFMRGRTLNDAFIILDEAQNTTPEQMKMFLTRMGFSSKVVVTGDITQVDLPKNVMSGLGEARRILKNIDGINFVYFTESDVVRHPLVGKIIRAYDQEG
jgi:phosphate starvation-inducible protein PhoH/intein/homing endonuclease